MPRAKRRPPKADRASDGNCERPFRQRHFLHVLPCMWALAVGVEQTWTMTMSSEQCITMLLQVVVHMFVCFKTLCFGRILRWSESLECCESVTLKLVHVGEEVDGWRLGLADDLTAEFARVAGAPNDKPRTRWVGEDMVWMLCFQLARMKLPPWLTIWRAIPQPCKSPGTTKGNTFHANLWTLLARKICVEDAPAEKALNQSVKARLSFFLFCCVCLFDFVFSCFEFICLLDAALSRGAFAAC